MKGVKGISKRVLNENHPIIKKKVNKALKLSIKEGAYASASNSLGKSYFLPFALAMGATSPQIGILHAFLSLFPGISELWATRNIGKKSNKKVVIHSLLWSHILLVGLVICAFLFLKGTPGLVWVVIGLVGLIYLIEGPASTFWFAWMGSLVPNRTRGSYFSKRQRVVQFVGLLSMLFAAVFLDIAKKTGSKVGQTLSYTLLAFGVLFILAFVFRMITLLLLSKQYEPHLKVRKKQKVTVKEFIKSCSNTPFGKYLTFLSLFNLAAGIATPFFVVYFIEELGLSYLWYILIIVSGILFELAFLPLIGRISDKYGNVALTKLGAFFISLKPLILIVSMLFSYNLLATKIFLLFSFGICLGISTGAWNISNMNYIYDATDGSKRNYAISYKNLLTGFFTFLGSLIGAGLALFSFKGASTILVIFALSFIFRILVSIFGTRKLKEVREVQEFKPHMVMQEMGSLNHERRQVNIFKHPNAKVVHHN